MNKIILVGHLGAAPVSRLTPQGKSTSTFSLATNETWKNQNGESQDKTEWHRIVMYGKMAETAAEYMKKGPMVYVAGRLETNEWEDQNQVKRKTTQVRCDNFTMLGRRQMQPQETASNDQSSMNSDDDIPF